MLILLFVIGLIILGFGIVCMCQQYGEKKFFNWVYKNEWFYWIINSIGACIMIIALSVAVVIAPKYSEVMIIDDKIALYEKENTKIEQNINELVEIYKDYESETFEKFKLDNPSIVFSMYPELKSDKLAAEQIELYISNNSEIKRLKEEKLEYEVYRWWLFF